MAQALKIAFIAKLCPVSAMVNDVVNIRRSRAQPSLRARAAERLSHQLRRSQLVPPFRRKVHPSPRLGLLAALAARCWSMLVAIAVAHQLAASWLPARPEWLHAHGLSPPCKNKSPHRQSRFSRVLRRRLMGSGSSQHLRSSSARTACISAGHSASPCRASLHTGVRRGRKQGRGLFHLLLSVYHIFSRRATVFLLLSANKQ